MTTKALSTKGQSPWHDELRATLLLAWPMILSNLTMMLIGVTDVILLGWLGPRALAAGALGHNLAIFCAIFCMGLITATAPMMASEKGRMAHSVLTDQVREVDGHPAYEARKRVVAFLTERLAAT